MISNPCFSTVVSCLSFFDIFRELRVVERSIKEGVKKCESFENNPAQLGGIHYRLAYSSVKHCYFVFLYFFKIYFISFFLINPRFFGF